MVNNYTEAFKVDSGAEVSAVPEAFPNLPPSLDRVDNIFSGPGEQPLNFLGSFMAALLRRGKATRQRLHVVKSLTVPLFGFPAIQALGVMKFIDKLSFQPQHLF